MNTRKPERALLGTSALVFAASAVVTVIWSESMSAMPGMQMPGGWTMSMTWMRMPGQSWLHAAATFIGMWTVMMVAMMLPSLLPMLYSYRQALGHVNPRRADRLTVLVGVSYFFAWTVCGVAAFALGMALAEAAMHMPALSRSVPVARAVVVLAAGVLQFTAWKAHQLACCRIAPTRRLPADAATAWRHGTRLGFDCIQCCLGLTSVLLIIGVMDLRAMALVACAITVERLAFPELRVARSIGGVLIAAALVMLTLEAGLLSNQVCRIL